MERIGFETETTEFKESTAELEKGIVSLTAMLNKNGFGQVLFGVNNKGEIVGQDIGPSTLRDISQAIDNFVDPPIIASIDTVECSDGRRYISVKADGKDRPYACRGNIYIRTGEEDRRVPMSELRVMFMTSGDNLIESLSNDQELTFRELLSILDENGISHGNEKTVAWSSDLTNASGRYNIQGQLMSDQNPVAFTVAVFSGKDRTVITHRTDFSGHCMLRCVNDVLEYVKNLNETSVDVGSGKRKERKLFDEDAFKEAWLNACVHNNWIGCTPPAVHIFDDRMEIISYGPKPYWLSDEEFYTGRSRPVNESLMRLFLATGLAEHTGHGVPIIVGKYGREAIKISNSGITVTLRFPGERWSASMRKGRPVLTDSERAVLEDLKIHPSKRLDDVSKDMGINRSYVGKIVVKLTRMGLVERIGSKKKGMWKVYSE